jgi:hypothetical protein
MPELGCGCGAAFRACPFGNGGGSSGGGPIGRGGGTPQFGAGCAPNGLDREVGGRSACGCLSACGMLARTRVAALPATSLPVLVLEVAPGFPSTAIFPSSTGLICPVEFRPPTLFMSIIAPGEEFDDGHYANEVAVLGSIPNSGGASFPLTYARQMRAKLAKLNTTVRRVLVDAESAKKS